MASKLKVSMLNRMHGITRWISRFIWAKWLLNFLFWELSGNNNYTPWHTLSETAWDVEEEYPGAREELETFLLALVIHIRWKYTLESSYDFAKANKENFNAGLQSGWRTPGR